MSTHKYFDRICVAVLIVTLLITVLFMNGERLGIQVSSLLKQNFVFRPVCHTKELNVNRVMTDNTPDLR